MSATFTFACMKLKVFFVKRAPEKCIPDVKIPWEVRLIEMKELVREEILNYEGFKSLDRVNTILK